ncbi:iron chaperone [Sphingobacterium sp. HJSM2_6]|uniref:iron chaperone n=1 Tax=Sphingobacterium sp. HJSM2_6 TaxID=3366264 RepID=UPI003BE26380
MKFNSIDEYIASFDQSGQNLLNGFRDSLNNIVPKGTLETINYNMPTWKYQGNLIHIALYKNHLGIYPGSAAIANFTADLTKYKCSKGAIQIPLDQPIPQDLLEKLVKYNLKLLEKK